MEPELARGGELGQGRDDAARRRDKASLHQPQCERPLPTGARARPAKKSREGRANRVRAASRQSRGRESGGCLQGRGSRGTRFGSWLCLSRRSPVHRASARRGGEAAVDQVVDGGLNVGVGRDDARFLQREACREDRVGLRLADGRMGELGALELAVDDGLRQLGVGDERSS